jgi:hypothetical protein
MKYLAAQMATGAQVMVLSPSRTIPRGWLTMRATLGFDGSARDLLSDMASAGSAILFVDSLDFYGEEERRTVNDLVREAATVPGLSVVVTARTGFGEAEPNWLPTEALDRLGRAEAVVITELSDAEIKELRDAAPQLNALLAENHPARPVTRNPFRLARLASRPASEMPRTEVEMADQWWQTADGALDAGHRERTRALVALASQALLRIEPLDAKKCPAAAITALVKSETVRDLGNDRVTFRHDVLRDWAIANLLFSDPGRIAGVSLDRPVPTSLMRGIELAARMMIERNADAGPWYSFLLSLSTEGAHGSWRRMALLALVRSEVAGQVLNKVAAQLAQDRAQLLRELIRLVMAVDAEPAAKRFATLGIDPKLIPVGMNLPTGLSWYRLIVWVLSLGVGVPAGALPEVVELYTAWSSAMFGKDVLTPTLVRWLYYWLSEIQGAAGQQRPFSGELNPDEMSALPSDLTTGFLLFCDKVPDLAVLYIRMLKERADRYRGARELPKFRGMLARAAPEEFAELTADLLLSKAEEDEDGPFREPFGHQNFDFVPASPAQGPFLDLLVAGPEHGLKLIRRLVDHEISRKSGGRAFGDDAITIRFPDGRERLFPWIRSYNWSRDVGAASAIVVSALMALEAWAHSRIDAGEPFDKVLADAIGTAIVPAAYLLVAVDLLISHGEQSRDAAIPYLACPELLCLDREREMQDNIEVPDIFGLKALQKEPMGAATLDSLKARASRRLSLEQLLASYALDEASENRDLLTELLRRAALRLGQPNPQSNLGDPEFMVVHALNLNGCKCAASVVSLTRSTNACRARFYEALSPRVVIREGNGARRNRNTRSAVRIVASESQGRSRQSLLG